MDLGIIRQPKEPDYITLNELLDKISKYIDQYDTTKSYIHITRIPAKERRVNNEVEAIKNKLLDITGDPMCIQLLEAKNYNSFFKFMDQYRNKINRYELQNLIAPLAEK